MVRPTNNHGASVTNSTSSSRQRNKRLVGGSSSTSGNVSVTSGDIVYTSVKMTPPSSNRTKKGQQYSERRIGRWTDLSGGGGTSSSHHRGSSTGTTNNNDSDKLNNNNRRRKSTSSSSSGSSGFQSIPDAPPMTIISSSNSTSESSSNSYHHTNSSDDDDESSAFLNKSNNHKKKHHSSSSTKKSSPSSFTSSSPNKRVDVAKSLTKGQQYQTARHLSSADDGFSTTSDDSSSHFTIQSFDLFQSPTQSGKDGNSSSSTGVGGTTTSNGSKLPFYVEAEELHKTTGRHKQKRDKERAKERERLEKLAASERSSSSGKPSASRRALLRKEKHSKLVLDEEQRSITRSITSRTDEGKSYVSDNNDNDDDDDDDGDRSRRTMHTLSTLNSAHDLNFGTLGVPNSAPREIVPTPRDLSNLPQDQQQGQTVGGVRPVFASPLGGGGGIGMANGLQPLGGITPTKLSPLPDDDAHSSDASELSDENKKNGQNDDDEVLSKAVWRSNQTWCERNCCPNILDPKKRIMLMIFIFVVIMFVLGAIAIACVVVLGGYFKERSSSDGSSMNNNPNNLPGGGQFTPVIYNEDPLRMEQLKSILIAYGRPIPMPFREDDDNDGETENSSGNTTNPVGAPQTTSNTPIVLETSTTGRETTDEDVVKEAAEAAWLIDEATRSRVNGSGRRRNLGTTTTTNSNNISYLRGRRNLMESDRPTGQQNNSKGNKPGGGNGGTNAEKKKIDTSSFAKTAPTDNNTTSIEQIPIIGKVIVIPNETALNDTSTMEYKAMEWLSDYDALQVELIPSNVHWLAQRYSLKLLLSKLYQDQNGFLDEHINYSDSTRTMHFINLTEHECLWFTNTTTSPLGEDDLEIAEDRLDLALLTGSGSNNEDGRMQTNNETSGNEGQWQSSASVVNEEEERSPATAEDVLALWDMAVNVTDDNMSPTVYKNIPPNVLVGCDGNLNVTSLALLGFVSQVALDDSSSSSSSSIETLPFSSSSSSSPSLVDEITYFPELSTLALHPKVKVVVVDSSSKNQREKEIPPNENNETESFITEEEDDENLLLSEGGGDDEEELGSSSTMIDASPMLRPLAKLVNLTQLALHIHDNYKYELYGMEFVLQNITHLRLRGGVSPIPNEIALLPQLTYLSIQGVQQGYTSSSISFSNNHEMNDITTTTTTTDMTVATGQRMEEDTVPVDKKQGLMKQPLFASSNLFFQFLTKLETFVMTNNRVEWTIPEDIKYMISLKNLTIRNNYWLEEKKVPSNNNNKPPTTASSTGRNAPSTPSSTITKVHLKNTRAGDTTNDEEKIKTIGLGSIPSSIGLMTTLEYLDLSNNQLESLIPLSLSSLHKLKVLDLSYNQLQGVIPLQIDQLSDLTVLKLNHNELSGRLNDRIGMLKDLMELDVSYNHLQGPIIGKTLLRLRKLTSFKASNNQLIGPIPWTISRFLESVKTFDVSYNNLRGSIPSEVFALNDLEVLNLSHNKFVENIPSNLGNARNLSSLILENNKLTGTIPEIYSLIQLKECQLSNNRFEGPLPESLGSATSLELFNITNNQFTKLPQDMSRLSQNLKHLIASHNVIEGTFPTSLFALQALETLDLSNNKLKGTLKPPKKEEGDEDDETDSYVDDEDEESKPSNIGQLTNVVYLDLSSNQIKGPLPKELGRLHKLTTIHLHMNQLDSTIPDTLDSLKQLQVLDLSYNSLKGEIPDALGSLELLQTLAFTCNQLYGSVPYSLIYLQNLEELYLEGNYLTGDANPFCASSSSSTPNNKDDKKKEKTRMFTNDKLETIVVDPTVKCTCCTNPPTLTELLDELELEPDSFEEALMDMNEVQRNEILTLNNKGEDDGSSSSGSTSTNISDETNEDKKESGEDIKQDDKGEGDKEAIVTNKASDQEDEEEQMNGDDGHGYDNSYYDYDDPYKYGETENYYGYTTKDNGAESSSSSEHKVDEDDTTELFCQLYRL